MRRFLGTLFCCLLLTGCAGLTPKSQTNTFSPPPAYTGVEVSKSDLRDVADQTQNGIQQVKRELSGELFKQQLSNQAVQNGLANLSGKITGIEANVGEIAGIKSQIGELTGIKAELKTDLNTALTAQAQAFTSATLDLRAEVTAKVDANLNAKLEAFKKEINTSVQAGRDSKVTNVDPTMIVGVVIIFIGLICLFGYLIHSQMRMKGEIKMMKALGFSPPTDTSK